MKKDILTYFIIIILGFVIGCDESVNDLPYENLPPQTSLFLYPDSTISPQPSKLKIGWWADDPDGLIIGYYYKWNGSDWEFTTKNAISFELQIGASDTLYKFQVAGVDNGGNGVYDNRVIRNGIDYGPEPFIDENNNGIYDSNEKYYDIGEIDPEPASQLFPIKNSAPTLEWNSLTSLPEVSFPVMTLGWNVDDLDGVETIRSINIALNDTNNLISLSGDVRNITIRAQNYSTDFPLMDIIINGNLSPEKLVGLKLNDNNKIYVQAEDISGAKSEFLTLPNSDEENWYVKKPKGKVLLIDDNQKIDNSEAFYTETLNRMLNGEFADKYDVWDIHKFEIPYESLTFSETINQFDALIWYSDNQPYIDLASSTLKNYIEDGGKVIFTSVLPHPVDILQLQDFLPVDSLGAPIKFVASNLDIFSDSTTTEYPNLKTTGSSIKVQTFYPSELAATSIYWLPDGTSDDSNVIGLKSNDEKIFFFGLPLHECDGNSGNVKIMLEKILFEDFGLSL